MGLLPAPCCTPSFGADDAGNRKPLQLYTGEERARGGPQSRLGWQGKPRRRGREALASDFGRRVSILRVRFARALFAKNHQGQTTVSPSEMAPSRQDLCISFYVLAAIQCCGPNRALTNAPVEAARATCLRTFAPRRALKSGFGPCFRCSGAGSGDVRATGRSGRAPSDRLAAPCGARTTKPWSTSKPSVLNFGRMFESPQPLGPTASRPRKRDELLGAFPHAQSICCQHCRKRLCPRRNMPRRPMSAFIHASRSEAPCKWPLQARTRASTGRDEYRHAGPGPPRPGAGLEKARKEDGHNNSGCTTKDCCKKHGQTPSRAETCEAQRLSEATCPTT